MLIVLIVGNIIKPLISFTFICSTDLRSSTTLKEDHANSRHPNATGISQYSGDRWTEPPNTTCKGGVYTMNMPRQAPARIPAKFHLFETTRLPKGYESLAFTANTLKHCVMKIER